MISDNGKGFDINHNTLGNGLNNMKKRITEINGEISIESDTKSGTKISITIPK